MTKNEVLIESMVVENPDDLIVANFSNSDAKEKGIIKRMSTLIGGFSKSKDGF